jgi:hypothetical protein
MDLLILTSIVKNVIGIAYKIKLLSRTKIQTWCFRLTGILILLLLIIADRVFAQANLAQQMDVTPKPYTVRYTPADSSISQTDPPAFVWLPVKGVKEYNLQYSRHADFPINQTVSIVCPRTIHVPNQSLGSGRWYWRFSVADSQSGQQVNSRVRTFTIAENAIKVPFPNVKSVIAKLKGVHPRDFVRNEDLQRYRKLGAGPLKSYIVELKKQCDRYIEGDLLPEPPFLIQSGQEKIVEFVRIMRSTRKFNAEMIACATTYLLTGEEKYGQEARRRLLYLTTWDPNGSTSLSHNDEPGHEIIRDMSRTYDWIYPLLDEDDKTKVRDILAVRMPQLYEVLLNKPFEVHPYESHAMDYYIGDLLESTLVMADELPVEEMLGYVLQQLWSPYFPPYGGDDGGWSEGPSYWQWSTATFLRNFALVKQNTGIDLTKKTWIQKTPYYKLYSNPPYSKMSPFGDGQSRPADAADIMYKLGVALDNPYALWYAQQSNGKPRGLERFVFYKEGEDQGKAPTDLPQARVFNDVGLVAMHSDLANGNNNVEFLLRSSPFGSISHSYADQNAFALFAYGEPLAIASGYYPYYGSLHHKEWTWETKASNSLLVDGKGQDVRDWNARGKIANFANNDYASYALGDATEAYGGRLTKFKRHILFLRPTVPDDEPIIILFDDVASPRPASYDWLLHSLEKMDINESTETVNIKRGAARLKVQFLAPQNLKFSQDDKFTAPPEGENMPNQWHLTAQTSDAEHSARFVTVLMPYREGQEAKLPKIKLIDKEGWIVIELTGPRTRQVAAFRAGAESGKVLKIAKFSTKADVAATAYDLKGKLRATIQVTNKQ